MELILPILDHLTKITLSSYFDKCVHKVLRFGRVHGKGATLTAVSHLDEETKVHPLKLILK